MARARPWLVLAHRWAGLSLAGFLVVAGLTGASMPFNRELNWLCAPAVWDAAPPRPGAATLSGPQVADRLAAQGLAPLLIPLDIDPRHAAAVFVTAAPGRPALGYDEVAVDPYSGAVRARMRFAALAAWPRDLPNFLYGLHYGYVAGRWGVLAFGLAGLVWTLDCFVGLALTWPAAADRRAGARGRLVRWGAAWRVRRARGFKLHYDLHQAGGLWLWALLLAFAWSSVALILPQAHDPVMRALGAEGGYVAPRLAEPRPHPRLSPAAAAARGEALMRAAGAKAGFRLVQPQGLSYAAASGAWRYAARTSLDVASEGGATQLWFRDADGGLLQLRPPLGRTLADGADAWMLDLHEAQVGGLPYRVFTSLFGLLVCALTVTGVLVWARKRAARLARPRRGAGPVRRIGRARGTFIPRAGRPLQT